MIPNADQIEQWSEIQDDGYVKVPFTIWPELIWILRKAEEAESMFEAQRAFLLSLPCEGMGHEEARREMHEKGWACIDIVPSVTRHMCLRCQVLLYMKWSHGFPSPRVAA